MKKLQIIVMIVLVFSSMITFGQVIKIDTLSSSRNTDFDFLELKSFEVLETARIFNDYDACKSNIEIKETEIAVKNVQLNKKDEQIASLVKAYYFGDTAIKKSDTIKSVDKAIKSLQTKQIDLKTDISNDCNKLRKSEKLKKNIYKFSFIGSLIYIGKLVLFK